MIIISHTEFKPTRASDARTGTDIPFSSASMSGLLFEIAAGHPQQLVVWCCESFRDSLHQKALPEIFHHKKIMASFHPCEKNYLPSAIGYADEKPSINVKKGVPYATWQMSSFVGGIDASALNAVAGQIHADADFDYFLNSLAKLATPEGLFCYSDPRLLLAASHPEANLKQADTAKLFRFVKQHYRMRWVFLVFLNLLVFEKRFAFPALCRCLFYRSRKLPLGILEKITVQSDKKVISEATIDVIIPTIGRKNYLYDVLNDLAAQTHLPKNVIIVEQNPAPDSESELDYLLSEKWPFAIKHVFTRQPGVCNARNIALSKTTSEWVFLGDDDNRFDANLLASVFGKIEQYGNTAFIASYLLKNEKKKYTRFAQSNIFGGGNVFVRRDYIEQVGFHPGFEFGYGEDNDFGMQLRNIGCDIIYMPEPEIEHLKAPIGGFRIKPAHPWDMEKIQPKPSPQIQLYRLRNMTREQFLGAKMIYFIKLFNRLPIKNPIAYYRNFEKQWNQSTAWAEKLKSKC